MSSNATHFTKIFPKRADITGSPAQAFHMQDNRDKYFKYLIGGISAGTIAAIGTIAPGGTFQYLYALELYTAVVPAVFSVSVFCRYQIYWIFGISVGITRCVGKKSS